MTPGCVTLSAQRSHRRSPGGIGTSQEMSVRVLIAAQEAFGSRVAGAPLHCARYPLLPQNQPKTRGTIEAPCSRRDCPSASPTPATPTPTMSPFVTHQEGITLVGQQVGSPIIAVPDPGSDTDKIAFFGPVVTPTPAGQRAARLWDGTLAVASTPGFYEIKRTRTIGPIFG